MITSGCKEQRMLQGQVLHMTGPRCQSFYPIGQVIPCISLLFLRYSVITFTKIHTDINQNCNYLHRIWTDCPISNLSQPLCNIFLHLRTPNEPALCVGMNENSPKNALCSLSTSKLIWSSLTAIHAMTQYITQRDMTAYFMSPPQQGQDLH